MESGTINRGREEQELVQARQAITTVGEVIRFLGEVPSGKDRWEAQQRTLEQMMVYNHRGADLMEEVYNYVLQDESYTSVMTKEEFLSAMSEVVRVVTENKRRRNRIEEAKRKVLTRWDEEFVSTLVSVNSSATFMAAARTLAAKFTAGEAVQRINRQMVNRLHHPRKGISAKKTIQTADLMNAANTPSESEVTESEAQSLGLRLGEHGLLVEGASLPLMTEELQGAGSGVPSSLSDFPSPAEEIRDTPKESEPGMLDPESPDAEGMADEDDALDKLLREAIDKATLDGCEVQEAPEDEASPALDGETDDGTYESPSKRRRFSCSCSKDVGESWKAEVKRAAEYTDAVALKLLATGLGYENVCFAHLKALGARVGLKIKNLDKKGLQQRLEFIHQNRLQIARMKVHNSSYRWWRRGHRPSRATDDLGPYKFLPAPVPEFSFDQTALRAWTCTPEDMRGWEKNGSVGLDIFSWWWGCEIGKLVETEWDMYLHHLRKVNDKPNYGWLRNSLYSIGQQLMRQDPKYYCAYVSLRPDKAWRLISYPYYMKYSVPGDQTYFRHMDLNIPAIIKENRGVNMIQGYVSMVDETEDNCTVILHGMHKHLAPWWERCIKRGQDRDGLVHRIHESMFPKEDAKFFGIDWEKIPQKKGTARIFDPRLPHGANGPAVEVRKIALPWLVSVGPDLKTLEVVEGGDWEMLSKAHRDMVSPSATPSGLANRYGAIPYKFQASVEVTGLGAVSDALVGRRKYDSPAVLRELRVLLQGDRKAADDYIKAWRQKAVQIVIDAFQEAVVTEKAIFGDKSYFYHLERFEQNGIPMPEIPEDEDEYNTEDERGEDDFAEKGVDPETTLVT